MSALNKALKDSNFEFEEKTGQNGDYSTKKSGDYIGLLVAPVV
jgi:hypothetical protein